MKPSISLVTPVYNEAKNIERTVSVACGVLDTVSGDYELVLAVAKIGTRCERNPCFGVFDSGHLMMKGFEEILLRLPGGFSELICHPGCVDETVKRRYPWNCSTVGTRSFMISRSIMRR